MCCVGSAVGVSAAAAAAAAAVGSVCGVSVSVCVTVDVGVGACVASSEVYHSGHGPRRHTTLEGNQRCEG